MFDERRHRITAGIDKSYLLEPIVVDTKTTTTKRVIAPSKPMRLDQKMSNYSKVIVPPLQNRLINQDINGNNHFSLNDDPLDRTLREPTKIVTKTTGITRKLTPAISSPPALKNVTNNQKVKRKAFQRFKSSREKNSFLSWLFQPCKIFYFILCFSLSRQSSRNSFRLNLFRLFFFFNIFPPTRDELSTGKSNPIFEKWEQHELGSFDVNFKVSFECSKHSQCLSINLESSRTGCEE